MHNRTLITLALTALFVLTLAACGGGSTTSASTGDDPAPNTGETTTGETPATEAEPPTAEPASAFGPSDFEGSFRLSVNYALPNPNPDDETTLLLTVQGGVANNSGGEVTITKESLFVADGEGNRYYANDPDERTRPPLVGTTLRNEFSGFGAARFTVPVDTEIMYFGWCPDNTDCPAPLVVEILR